VVAETTDQQTISVADVLASGRLVTVDSSDGEPRLGVPIRVRGEVIGAFGFGGETLRNLAEEDLLLVEAVVDRVGLALENMRLVEETVRRAEHEQILNEITAKIVGSTDVNDILQTTVRELGRVLRAPQTSVQLRHEGE
jgi:GAF domain-containing protein